ncbi:MAG: hypothetical protein JRH17_18005 [Deltaproteobacteria bacterium]|nr:hypothetical protein [Deltaproteobacteria bacterium]MBW2696393.1 hypothetical protein [Deltaproteobacteria bacterium]
MGWPRSQDLHVHIGAYQADREEINAVYLGSSYTGRGIDPTVVDPIIASELGAPFTSYNLAIDGALGFEVDFLLHSMFVEPAPRLRLIVIEAPDLAGRVPRKLSTLSRRNLYWHGMGWRAGKLHWPAPSY